MANVSWLRNYYGKWYGDLNPVLLMDGKYHAVVQVRQVGKAAYVLIKKSGSHESSTPTILHEGVPTSEKYKQMRDALTAADAA